MTDNPNELRNELMYALFAPDGSFQAMTLSPDFPTCVAVIRMLHKSKMGKSFHELCVIGGFKVLPCLVTVIPTGNEDTAFKVDQN